MPDVTIEQALAIALQHHQAGRLGDAEPIYRQILAHSPNHPQALHLLGILAIQAGRNDLAIDLIKRCVAIMPRSVDALSNLSTALRNAGRVDEAIDAARTAARIDPQFAGAHFNLGIALADRGELDDAIAAYRAAIAIQPNHAEAYLNLGIARGHQGRFDEAVEAVETANRIRPSHALTHHTLGNLWVALGRTDQAIASFRTAVALNPNDARSHNNLGVALFETGHIDEGIAEYRAAIRIEPNYPEPYSNLANALSEQGKFSEALEAGEMAVRLKPDYASAHYNLGNIYTDVGRLDEAVNSYLAVTRLNPNRADAYTNMGVAYLHRGQLDDAIAAYRKAIDITCNEADTHNSLATTLKAAGRIEEAAAESQKALQLRTDAAGVHSNLILVMLYDRRFDPAAVSTEARKWAEQYEAPLRSAIAPHENDRTPDRRLRIGYISADFRAHPIGRFMRPIFSARDAEAFEVFVYSDLHPPDVMTKELRGCADQWRDTKALSAAALAERIRQDRIDILVDLAGHSAHNRLLVFARKPAPVQVSYLGFPATTGLKSIDYRLTDIHADPPEDAEKAKRDYTEELIRLPATAWCWQLPEGIPAAEREARPFTFGCLSNFAKVSESMLRLWGKILRGVPGSRLLLKSISLSTVSLRERVLRILREEGIEPERAELLGHEVPYLEHLALYQRIDLVLDTFPYHGTTTTCEALSMGVPVVSLVGEHHVSRVGVSLLQNAGLPEFLAGTQEEYAEIAIRAANDLSELEGLRAGLRDRLAGSALMDQSRFVADLGAAYRQMWKTWCASPDGVARHG